MKLRKHREEGASIGDSKEYRGEERSESSWNL
jgi:hypothetical protein